MSKHKIAFFTREEQPSARALGESTPIILLNALARNIGVGLGMAFLDGVFSRLANEARIELLARLNNFGLEQIIVFESFVFEKGLLEKYESNIVELAYQHLAGAR